MDSLQKCSVPKETWSSTFHPSTPTSFPAFPSSLMLDFRVSSFLQCKKPSNCSSHHHSQSWLSPSKSRLLNNLACDVQDFSSVPVSWHIEAKMPEDQGKQVRLLRRMARRHTAWRLGGGECKQRDSGGWLRGRAYMWMAEHTGDPEPAGTGPSEPEQETDAKGGIILETWEEQWSPQEAVNKDRNLLKVDWRPEMRLSLSRKPATEIESMNRYLFTIKWSFIINFMCNAENSSCVHIDLWKTHVKLQTDSNRLSMLHWYLQQPLKTSGVPPNSSSVIKTPTFHFTPKQKSHSPSSVISL